MTVVRSRECRAVYSKTAVLSAEMNAKNASFKNKQCNKN